MQHEQISAASIEEIKQSRIAQVELPETLVGAFQLAKTVASGDFS